MTLISWYPDSFFDRVFRDYAHVYISSVLITLPIDLACPVSRNSQDRYGKWNMALPCSETSCRIHPFSIFQWEFQDPKMEVLYHIRQYFVELFPDICLKTRPYIWFTSNLHRFLLHGHWYDGRIPKIRGCPYLALPLFAKARDWLGGLILNLDEPWNCSLSQIQTMFGFQKII